jgi:hypothetical protein
LGLRGAAYKEEYGKLIKISQQLLLKTHKFSCNGGLAMRKGKGKEKPAEVFETSKRAVKAEISLTGFLSAFRNRL